jgi:hypothetical protein
MRVFAAIIQIAGAALVVAGVSLWSPPAAMVLAGVFAVAIGVAIERAAA